ncbi:MAG: carbohydrate kinase [Pseudomonadota bacterium]
MILCCGEALIDMIPNADGAFAPHTGGAIFNTAIGIGRQGATVGLLSGISNDVFGDLLSEKLEKSQVAKQYLIRSDRPTTLAFVKLVDGKASYAFYDENTAGRMIADKDLPDHLPKGIKALFFGGISLAVEPCADTYLSALKQYSRNRIIMVDPNIRPSFIEDESRYRDRMRNILDCADIIKISDEDLDWLDGSKRDRDTKAEEMLGNKTKLVCLTLGGDGVKAFHENGVQCAVRAPKKDVVDTVGAGDAFNAGVLTHLDRNHILTAHGVASLSENDLSAMLEFASHFAADTVTRAGSDPAWHFEIR